MTNGSKWRVQAEAAAAVRAERMLDAAERQASEALPDARIERGTGELRINAPRLLQRWIADPTLRFVLWSAK